MTTESRGLTNSYLTAEEISALQDSVLPTDMPFLMRGVSQGQLSVARYYGGLRFNGADYTYQPQTDELIRDDVLQMIERRRKRMAKEARKAKVAEGGEQMELL